MNHPQNLKILYYDDFLRAYGKCKFYFLFSIYIDITFKNKNGYDLKI